MKEELKHQVHNKLDEEFLNHLIEIEARYGSLNKQEKHMI